MPPKRKKRSIDDIFDNLDELVVKPSLKSILAEPEEVEPQAENGADHEGGGDASEPVQPPPKKKPRLERGGSQGMGSREHSQRSLGDDLSSGADTQGDMFASELTHHQRHTDEVVELTLYYAGMMEDGASARMLLDLVKHLAEHKSKNILQTIRRKGRLSGLLAKICAFPLATTSGLQYPYVLLLTYLVENSPPEVLSTPTVLGALVRVVEVTYPAGGSSSGRSGACAGATAGSLGGADSILSPTSPVKPSTSINNAVDAPTGDGSSLSGSLHWSVRGIKKQPSASSLTSSVEIGKSSKSVATTTNSNSLIYWAEVLTSRRNKSDKVTEENPAMSANETEEAAVMTSLSTITGIILDHNRFVESKGAGLTGGTTAGNGHSPLLSQSSWGDSQPVLLEPLNTSSVGGGLLAGVLRPNGGNANTNSANGIEGGGIGQACNGGVLLLTGGGLDSIVAVLQAPWRTKASAEVHIAALQLLEVLTCSMEVAASAQEEGKVPALKELLHTCWNLLETKKASQSSKAGAGGNQEVEVERTLMALRVALNLTSLIPDQLVPTDPKGCAIAASCILPILTQFSLGAEGGEGSGSESDLVTVALCLSVNLLRYSDASDSYRWTMLEDVTLMKSLVQSLFNLRKEDAVDANVTCGYLAVLVAALSLGSEESRVAVVSALTNNLPSSGRWSNNSSEGESPSKGALKTLFPKERPMKGIAAILQEFILFQSHVQVLTQSSLTWMQQLVDLVIKENDIRIE